MTTKNELKEALEKMLQHFIPVTIDQIEAMKKAVEALENNGDVSHEKP